MDVDVEVEGNDYETSKTVLDRMVNAFDIELLWPDITVKALAVLFGL